jgi:catechol 2,3-dioxygenase-like lactoylglutathione lyase family enzyme
LPECKKNALERRNRDFFAQPAAAGGASPGNRTFSSLTESVEGRFNRHRDFVPARFGGAKRQLNHADTRRTGHAKVTANGPKFANSKDVEMARIRFLAINCIEPQALANFYQTHLGMEELGRSDAGDVALTDGYFNLTFVKLRPELNELRRDPGPHHMGLEVDSIDETLKLYRQMLPGGVAVREPRGVTGGEIRIFDPECNPISLSENAFGVRGEERRLPRMIHIASHNLQPQRTADFMMRLFGLRELPTTELRRKAGRFNCFLGDGLVNLALHPYYRSRDAEGFATYDRVGHDNQPERHEERRFGIHHFGFLMRDARQKVAELSDSDAAVADRPEVRPYAEYRAVDPEGNGFDLSQHKGWEVDVDKWDKVA